MSNGVNDAGRRENLRTVNLARFRPRFDTLVPIASLSRQALR